MNSFYQPDGVPPPFDRNGRSLPFPPGPAASSAWTIHDKIHWFRQLPPILCPASPPPLENPLMTEEEAANRSRERIERMTKRLASLPLYQARHLIDLTSTQLKGPFSQGSKYWGMAPPVTNSSRNHDLGIKTPASSPQAKFPPLKPQTQNPPPKPSFNPPRKSVPPSGQSSPPSPRNTAPSEPGPPPPDSSSTVISGPVSPATPPPSDRVDVDLVPAKTSTGRPLVPIDYDKSSPARSPTPTPSMPPPSRIGSQMVTTSRPPETPASQRTLMEELQQVSALASGSQVRQLAKSRSPRGLRIFPTPSQPRPKHSTPALRPNRRRPSEPRDSDLRIRLSQMPDETTLGPLTASQIPPRFSQDIAPSQRESSGEEFYDSQLDFDNQLQDITRFIEDDIGN